MAGAIAELAKRAAGLHDKPHYHQPVRRLWLHAAAGCRSASDTPRIRGNPRGGCPSDWHHSVVSLKTCRARCLAGQVAYLQTGCARPGSTASPTPRRRRRALLAAWWSWLHSPPSGQCRQSQFQTQVGDLVSQQMTSHPQQQTEFAGCLLKILGITRWPGHRARYAAARDAYSQYGLRLDVAG